MGVAEECIETKVVNFSEPDSDEILNLLIKNDKVSNENFILYNSLLAEEDWNI